MQKVCLVALCAALGVTSLAAQRRGGSDPEKIWSFLKEKYDKDGDGQVAKSEYDRGEEKFARYDKTKDGVLTDADFTRKSRRNNAGRMITMVGGQVARAADSDKSGSVTKREWQGFVAAVCHEDGSLDVDALVKKIPQQSQGGQRGQGGQRRGRRGGFRMSPAMLDRMMDFDESGAFDRADMSALFVKMDKDEDGTIGKAEMPRSRTRGAQKPVFKVGDDAPDFDLPLQSNPQKSVKLSSFAGNKPVALIFGSYT